MENVLFHLITGVLACLSLVGVGLIAKKRWQGWIVLMLADIGWATNDFVCCVPVWAILHVIYFCIALFGLWEWHYKDKKWPRKKIYPSRVPDCPRMAVLRYRELQFKKSKRDKERDRLKEKLNREKS